LLLWLAIPSWETGTHQTIAAEQRTVTLAFAEGRHLSATSFDDTGTVTTRLTGYRRNLTLLISGNVTIVEIR
jgi:hypothetical protein